MGNDILTAIGQAAGISGVVTAVLWAKLRGLDKSVTGLNKSVVELQATTAVGNERLNQVEKRLDGNGSSVPARCGVHDAKLTDLERRVEKFE